MEDRFKERVAAALMGDLLVALAKRDAIKEMLGDLEGWAADDLIRQLLDSFEKNVAELRARVLEEQARAMTDGNDAPTVNPPENPPREDIGVQTPPLLPDINTDIPSPSRENFLFGLEELLDEGAKELLGQSFPSAPDPHPLPPEAETPSTHHGAAVPGSGMHQKKESPERYAGLTQEAASVVPAEVPPQVASPVTNEVQFTPSPAAKQVHPKVPYELAENEFVYIHGASILPPAEPPSSKPFMLEEKGIEDKDFAFAIDHRGLRFYLSKIHTRSSNISKAGLLLLSKRESIMMRGRHEGILNELRRHGVLLPFEFGTVARGKEELLGKIDDHLPDLVLAAEDISKTSWWEVNVYALDARVMQGVMSETPSRSGRERGRSSYSSLSTSKVDIKTLERLLGKQKRIAETVHSELSAVAERSDVDMKISLGGGTSEDWKLILKASYEIPVSRVSSFNRVVTDIQYRHFPFEIMLAVSGEREPFSFQA